jgi:N-acetylglucosamine kinase-like BadF-type ATPase
MGRDGSGVSHRLGGLGLDGGDPGSGKWLAAEAAKEERLRYLALSADEIDARANAGCAISRALLCRGAQSLFSLVSELYQALLTDQDCNLVLHGSVILKSRTLKNEFLSEVQRKLPKLVVSSPWLTIPKAALHYARANKA